MPFRLSCDSLEKSRIRRKRRKRIKRGILLCLLALLLLLTACGGEKSPNVYEQNGYTVDLENRTITHGEDVYTYVISGSGSSSEITITYPNGATYYWTWSGSFGHGGWSDDYDPSAYVDGDVLLAVLGTDRATPERGGGNPLLGLLIIGLGIGGGAAPRSVWYLSYGWRYKDAEPADMALVAERLGGGVAIVVGLALLFV